MLRLTSTNIRNVSKNSNSGLVPVVSPSKPRLPFFHTPPSPALVEKVRGVTTDERGEYKIADLRPGTYSVTFTLPGF